MGQPLIVENRKAVSRPNLAKPNTPLESSRRAESKYVKIKVSTIRYQFTHRNLIIELYGRERLTRRVEMADPSGMLGSGLPVAIYPGGKLARARGWGISLLLGLPRVARKPGPATLRRQL